MKKIFLISFIIMLTMAVRTSVYAAQGWPANYSGVMLQGFYWDSYDESKWYALTERADELSKYFDLIWIPQAGTETTVSDYESTTQSMGYNPIYYFKYNSIFGSETQLRTMINTYKAKGTGIIEDVVINHKQGVTGWCDFADESVVGQNTGKTYSVTWDNTNYSGICNNDEANSNTDSEGYGKITGAADTGDNFDGYRDLDHTNATVQQNLITYQDYLLNELGFAGFRLDMVKGYSGIYTKMYNEAVNPTYSVGEYWDSKDNITNWIKTTNYTSAAFDFPLHNVLQEVFDNNNWSALSDKSFTADANYNRYSVTFVDNHDTFREDGTKVNNSWSAANAFILAMPGTPCIFLPHYTADPTHIQAMITARKACGITNQSTILTQELYTSGYGYTIETQGTKGKVLLLLGDAAKNQTTTPDGYTLVASSDDWTNYKFYATKTNIDPEVVFSVKGGTFTSSTTNVTLTPNSTASTAKYKIGDGSWTTITQATTITLGADLGNNETVTVSWEANDGTNTMSGSYTFTKKAPKYVYFNNTGNWTNVYAYVWNSATGEYTKGWPGTLLTETTTEGNYKFEIADFDCDMIIFNDGGTNQTKDCSIIDGYTYNGTVPVANSTGYRVYFSNTSSWETVNCYSWNGSTKYSGEWPGTAMTYDSSLGYYYIDFSGEPDKLIFNDGTNQTENLTFTNGNLYNASGNSSAYATVLTSTTSVNLTDDVAYTSASDVVADNATYTRTTSNEWGTLCLPFAYTGDNSVKFYTFKCIGTDKVTVSEVDNVKAGQPVIYRVLSQNANDSKYHLSVSSDNVLVKAANYGKTDTPVEGWTMNGTYAATKIQNSGSTYEYFIANNMFWYAEIETTVPAYRAWLESTTSKAKSLNISFDDDTDGIGNLTPTLSQGEGARKYLEGGRIVIVKDGRKYTTSGQILK